MIKVWSVIEEYLMGVKMRWRAFLTKAYEVLTKSEVRRSYIKELLQELFPPWVLYVFCTAVMWLTLSLYIRNFIISFICLACFIFVFFAFEIYDWFFNRKSAKPVSSYVLVGRIIFVFFLLTACLLAICIIR